MMHKAERESNSEHVDDKSPAAMFARELQHRQARDMAELDNLYKRYSEEKKLAQAEEQGSNGMKKMQQQQQESLGQSPFINAAGSVPRTNQQFVNQQVEPTMGAANIALAMNSVSAFPLRFANQPTTSLGGAITRTGGGLFNLQQHQQNFLYQQHWDSRVKSDLRNTTPVVGSKRRAATEAVDTVSQVRRPCITCGRPTHTVCIVCDEGGRVCGNHCNH